MGNPSKQSKLCDARLVELTVWSLASAETMTENLQLLPVKNRCGSDVIQQRGNEVTATKVGGGTVA